VKRAAAFLLPLVFASCVDQGPTAPSSLAPDGPSLAAKVRSADGEFSFTTIEVPGAVTTIAWGINARGDVVGEYFDAAARRHGFLLRKGVFTPIDVAGALGTSARGINPRGDIVGVYRDPGEPIVNAHGFLLTRHGDLVKVDFPGHTNTIPQRILPDGTILGCRHDNDTMGSMKGIVMSRAGNSEVDAFASMHNGATPGLRRIVGLWTNMMTGRGEGYVIEDGEFTSFVVPGSTRTAAWDVNAAGEIVGVYANANGLHGFVRMGDEDEYLPVDFPGATATQAFAINARGDVVGSYTKAGKTFGFLARRNRGSGAGAHGA
jgi:uncharacterized membrane protein